MRTTSISTLAILAVTFLFINFNCKQGGGNQPELHQEGAISYKISYPDLNAQQGRMKQMLPTEMKIFYKGQKSRIETKGKSPMANSITIYDGNNKSATTLLNMRGRKLALSMPKSQIEKRLERASKVSVKDVSGTKKIAGYDCQKAVINDQDTVFYTKAFQFKGTNFNKPYQDSLQGAMLEFSMQNKRMNMKAEATKVDLDPVSDTLFNIPDDYKKVSRQEFQQILRQQGGMGR